MYLQQYNDNSITECGLFNSKVAISNYQILGRTYLFDNTIKALLTSRLEAKENDYVFSVYFSGTRNIVPEPNDFINEINNDLLHCNNYVNIYRIRQFDYDQNDIKTFISNIRERFKDYKVEGMIFNTQSIVKGGKIYYSLEEFIEERALILSNKERNSAVIIAYVEDISMITNIAAARLPYIFPNLFEGNNSLNDIEKKLIKAIEGNDYDDIVCMFKQIIRNAIAGSVGKDIIKNLKLNILQRNINSLSYLLSNLEIDYQNSIRVVSETYKKLETTRNDITEKKNQLKKQKTEANDELNYMLYENKDIELVSINSERICLDIASDVVNYDPETFESCLLEDSESVLNDSINWDVNDLNEKFDEENISYRRMLLREIFLNETCKLRMATRVNIDIENRRVTFCLPDSSFLKEHSCIPNFHLTNYGCTGGYINSIQDAINKYDIPVLINILIACCANLNFADTTVMERFIEGIFGYYADSKCIEYKTEYISPIEAADVLYNDGYYDTSDERFNRYFNPEDEGYINLDNYANFELGEDKYGDKAILYNGTVIIYDSNFEVYDGKASEDGTFVKIYYPANILFDNINECGIDTMSEYDASNGHEMLQIGSSLEWNYCIDKETNELIRINSEDKFEVIASLSPDEDWTLTIKNKDEMQNFSSDIKSAMNANISGEIIYFDTDTISGIKAMWAIDHYIESTF